MTTKFKSRYVLGEGYPWVWEDGKDGPYRSLEMWEHPDTGVLINLSFDDELKSSHCPKYRLVLERVE